MVRIEKEKKIGRKINQKMNYRSFSVLDQTTCRLACVHCRSVLEANDLSSGILNALSFSVWSKRRVVRSEKGRLVVWVVVVRDARLSFACELDQF